GFHGPCSTGCPVSFGRRGWMDAKRQLGHRCCRNDMARSRSQRPGPGGRAFPGSEQPPRCTRICSAFSLLLARAFV
ncbi:unnamed protein product, partial [Ectocarpus sp. 4 AP-2014]